MHKAFIFCVLIAFGSPLYAQAASITGAVDWGAREINVTVSLNLKSAGIHIPSGRAQAARILHSEYGHFMNSLLLSLSVNSATTIGDLINQGEFSAHQVEALVQSARSTGPVLSTDMSSLQDWYTIDIDTISTALIRHTTVSNIPRSLMPVPTEAHTGIIIIANNPLPVHGRNSTTLAVPTLFPKIWDTNMNLIYERNTVEPLRAQSSTLVTYISPERIFYDSPSGMDEDLLNLVGPNPLRIIARSLFGIRPADLIIDRDDALRIISSEENRRLLRESKMVIVLDSSVLKVTLH
ncbi:MAG: polymerase [Spirochaetaceae bacterium]|nr:polymerase [Spirochaetaceae bacterium]